MCTPPGLSALKKPGMNRVKASTEMVIKDVPHTTELKLLLKILLCLSKARSSNGQLEREREMQRSRVDSKLL